MSGWLSRWMQEQGIIEGDDREIYQYGIRRVKPVRMGKST